MTENELQFEKRVQEELKYYVYLLSDPREAKTPWDGIFYVGKGIGNRAFSHEAAVLKRNANKKVESAKNLRIKEIHSSGKSVTVKVLRHNLQDEEAFNVEAAAIDLLHSLGANLTNIQGGHHNKHFGLQTPDDLKARYGAKKLRNLNFGGHRIVLIRVPKNFHYGDDSDGLFQATRQWWKVGESRRELGSSTAPEWAAAVHRGVIRDIYRITSWKKRRKDGEIRWGFDAERTGVKLDYLKEQYLNADVSDLFASGAQWPLLYVNC